MSKLLLKIVLGANVAFAAPLLAQENITQQIILQDDPVLAMMDSLDVLNFFKTHNFVSDKEKLNIYQYPADSVPLFDEFTYQKRMTELDQKSPFALDYNSAVKSYIELYAVKRRGTVSRMLGLGEMYFPMFEEALARHQMPLELKYLSIVESALNPSVRSKAGAMGLWQFMFGTGKMMGLEINSYVDERCDPLKATDAACRYLKYLYNYYNGDWQLALAAYNAGPGNINKAIRRAGGEKNYWKLRDYMPKETAGYVPAFIAVNYIMNYAKEHNIYPVKPTYHFYELDSVMVKDQVSFDKITAFVNISKDELKTLNPAYITGVIPASTNGYALFLPKNLIGDYMVNEANIKQYIPVPDTTSSPMIAATTSVATSTDGKKVVEHKVEPGDYLVSVARRYKVRTSDIVGWNGLKSEELYAGQVLKIYPDDENAPAITEQQASSTQTNSVATTVSKYHTIQKGDTLWNISQRYNVSVDDLLKMNNMSNSRDRKSVV